MYLFALIKTFNSSSPTCEIRPLNLNFIYFTTITKQVLQLILIMLVGTDVCIWVVSMWEETESTQRKPTCLTW